MLRSLCVVCLAMLMGWSAGIHAGEITSAVNPEDAVAASAAKNAPDGVPTGSQALATRINGLQVPFVANDERVLEEAVKFFAKTVAGSVLVANNGITYYLKRGSKPNPSTVAIKETWVKPQHSQASGIKPSKARFNFFKGGDQNKWKRNIAAFDEVGFGQVYDGIHVTLKAYNNNVEKIFSVASGADPGRIAIRVDGVSDLRINKAGELEFLNREGTLKMTAPVAYQEVDGNRQYVKTAYHRVSKNTYGFKVAEYDRSLPLVIDPLLASTFLGDIESDNGYAIDSDNATVNPSIYVTGWTNSAYFPITIGAYDPIQEGGSYDAFVSKYDAGLNLLASTFLGGGADDFGMAITPADLDGDGVLEVVYVAGSTKSDDFPIPVADNGTTTAFDTRFNGAQDGFLCRFNSDLTDLHVATYLGGTGAEQIYAMKAAKVPTYDATYPLLVYVAGPTQSKNFPVLADSAYSVVLSGNNDVFVSAFDQDLRLHFSTLLGGTASDIPYALDVKAEKVFVAGTTLSTNFPTTPGAYRRVLAGSKADGFVSQLNFSLGLLQGSTLLGGSADDAAYALAVDGDDTVVRGVYVAGYTSSVNFPTFTHYSKGKKTNGKEDLFVARLTADLKGRFQDNTQYAATLMGGSMSDYATAMKLDSAHERLVVTGYTKSTNFPMVPTVTPPGVKPYTAHNGGQDGFVMFVDDNLTAKNPIIESVYIGGKADDRPVGLVLIPNGDLYIVGTTKSSGYPTTDSSAYSAKEDVFISAFPATGLR